MLVSAKAGEIGSQAYFHASAFQRHRRLEEVAEQMTMCKTEIEQPDWLVECVCALWEGVVLRRVPQTRVGVRVSEIGSLSLPPP